MVGSQAVGRGLPQLLKEHYNHMLPIIRSACDSYNQVT